MRFWHLPSKFTYCTGKLSSKQIKAISEREQKRSNAESLMTSKGVPVVYVDGCCLGQNQHRKLEERRAGMSYFCSPKLFKSFQNIFHDLRT